MKTKIVLVLFVFTWTAVGHASLLVYEGFNYAGTVADNATLNGVATTATGLSGSYTVTNSSATGTAGSTVFESTGLTFGTHFATSGGAILMDATTTGGSTGSSVLAATPGTGAQTGTLYSSYLFNISTLSTVATSSLASRVNGHYQADGDSGSGVGTPGVANSTGFSSSAGAVSAGTTYLAISQFTRVGSNFTTGSPGVATIWVFTLSAYDSWVAAGQVESSLGTYASFTASHSDTSGTFTFDNSNPLQLVLGAGSGGGTTEQSATVDELRWGTTLADVTPSPVPEPGTWAMLAAGLGGMAWRLRRNIQPSPVR